MGLVTACTSPDGLTGDILTGEMTMTARTNHLILQDSSSVWHNIWPGTYQMSVSIMSNSVEILKDGQKLMHMNVPAGAFIMEDVLMKADDLEQVYDVHRHTDRNLISSNFQTLKESCMAPGTCNGCSIGIDSDGLPTSNCYYGAHLLCPGSKDQYYRFDEVNYNIKLDFLLRGNVHGTFTAKGQQKMEKTLTSSGSCIVHPSR